MYFTSSLTFGILLLCRASFAHSAPHQEMDEDEEALIDRLASLAAVVGPDALSKSIMSNYDTPQMGGYYRAMNDELLAREELASLPRQFAYKPTDLRYYMPAEQFPNYYPEEKAELENTYRQVKVLDENSKTMSESRIPQQESISSKTFSDSSNINNLESLNPNNPPPQQETVPFMKKNQPNDGIIHPVKNIIAEPSNILSSGHSVEKPYLNVLPMDNDQPFSYSDIYYIGLIAGCSAVVVVGLVAAGICWYRIHQRVKAAAEVDYPAYGVTGPNKDVSPSGGDQKLANQAHLYHYQHQKQQMAALQKGAIQQGDRQGSGGSDVESEDENDDDNDYTVYECPGLAPAGEMEVKNPLYQDEPTPASPQPLKSENEDK